MTISSKNFFIDSMGYFVDLPEGWDFIDSSNLARIAFADPLSQAVFQIYSFTGDSFNKASDIFNHIKTQLKAEGDGAPFIFCKKDAVFADLSFNTGAYDVRGYFVFINGKKFDYALLCFAHTDYYKKYHEFFLSCIDSFSIKQQGNLMPGPVSQFYYPYSKKNHESIKLIINNKEFKAYIDKKEMEATQILVEREAKILATYKDDYIKA